MRRITGLLLSGGALALAACSGGDGGNNVAANEAVDNVSADSMMNEVGGEAVPTAPAAPAAPAATSAPDAAGKESPRPEATPAPRTEQPDQAAPQPAPRQEPTPPPKADCSPEHRAAGHC